MSITKMPNGKHIGAIRTSVHFIRNYFDAQALPNTPPPSPLPHLSLSSHHHKTSKMDRLADELMDMYSAERNNNQRLNTQIVQLTKERESLKQQLTECEQSTQQVVCHYVGLLEKERLETKKWMSLATKQEQLVSTLEKKESSHQLKYKVKENELEDKQKLLDLLIDERQILLKRINSKTPPLLLKPSSSSIRPSKSTPSYHRQTPPTPITPTSSSSASLSTSKRSSIDLLEQMAMYPLTPIRRTKIDTSPSHLPPPPSPPPHIPLPQLPPSPHHHRHQTNKSSSKSKKQTFHRSQPPLPKSAIKSKLNQTYKRGTMPENKQSLFNISFAAHHDQNKYRKDDHFISF